MHVEGKVILKSFAKGMSRKVRRVLCTVHYRNTIRWGGWGGGAECSY